jgi:hypothetical protein
MPEPPAWTAKDAGELAELHRSMLVLPDPLPGTAKRYIDFRVRRAISAVFAAERNLESSRFEAKVARQALGFEQALQRALEEGSEFLRTRHQYVDRFSRLRPALGAQRPESSMEERPFRIRLLDVTGALDQFARVAGNPFNQQTQQARREVALAFNGLTHAPFIFLDRQKIIQDLVDDIIDPKYPRPERFWNHPSLRRLREAQERRERAHDANLRVVLRGQAPTFAELAIERELLRAELQFNKLKPKLLARIDTLGLPHRDKFELERFLGGTHRSVFRIWDLQHDLKNNLKETAWRRIADVFGLDLMSAGRSHTSEPVVTVSQRFGKVAALTGYGAGLITAAGAFYNGDYSAGITSAGLVGASFIPDGAHYGARALARGGWSNAARWMTSVSEYGGRFIAGGLFVLANIPSAIAMNQADQAQAELARLEQGPPQGAASERQKQLAAARDKAGETQTAAAFARFNARLSFAALLMTSPVFLGRVGPTAAVGLIGLGVNGFDTLAQYAGWKEPRAKVAELLDKYVNNITPYDTWLRSRLAQPIDLEPTPALRQVHFLQAKPVPNEDQEALLVGRVSV